jgi:putative intracellular protease/amidase
LKHFHASEKPTAAICHGPIALLSAQDEPQTYNTAMKTQGSADANNWIYADYKMTIFSEAEEEVFESSLENAKLLYYPSDAMATAGGDMKYSKMWTPKYKCIQIYYGHKLFASWSSILTGICARLKIEIKMNI